MIKVALQVHPAVDVWTNMYVRLFHSSFRKLTISNSNCCPPVVNFKDCLISIILQNITWPWQQTNSNCCPLVNHVRIYAKVYNQIQVPLPNHLCISKANLFSWTLLNTCAYSDNSVILVLFSWVGLTILYAHKHMTVANMRDTQSAHTAVVQHTCLHRCVHSTHTLVHCEYHAYSWPI